MDGWLDITGPPGGPTRVSVELPLHSRESVPPRRVVIAEDAAMMREGLSRLLADRGHDVPAAVADAVWWMFMSGHRLPCQGR
ncbi:MAG TPA: hypothetical protein VIV12_03630 [Streptosporangiaceae bacterium]